MKQIKAKSFTLTVAEIITIIISVVALLISCVSIAVDTINSRYNVSAIGPGIEVVEEFTSGSAQYEQGTIEPCKGIVKWGWQQGGANSGSSIQYTFKYKKTTSSSWTNVCTTYFNYNGVWSSAHTLVSANGYTDYNYMFTKISGNSLKSTLYVDFFVD